MMSTELAMITDPGERREYLAELADPLDTMEAAEAVMRRAGIGVENGTPPG